MIVTLFSLALATAPAVQDPVAPAASVRVGYGDLDLRTPAGRAALDRRLDRAVRKACPAPDHRDLRQLQAAEACHAVATASADRQRRIALAAVDAAPVRISSVAR